MPMPVPAPPYPVNLVLAGRPVLVVGGGSVAAAKVRGLLEAGARVHVVATEVGGEVRAMDVTWEQRPYERGEVAGYRYVVACTDDADANQAVYDDAEMAGIFVNAADDPERCSATLPARLHRGPLLVTVSTSGQSPALAAWLRDRLGEVVGPEYETLVDVLAEARSALAEAGRSRPPADWRRALDSGMLDLIREGRIGDAKTLLAAALAAEPPPPEQS